MKKITIALAFLAVFLIAGAEYSSEAAFVGVAYITVANDWSADQTMVPTGTGDAPSYKWLFESNKAAGPVTGTGSILSNYDGFSFYMLFSAPNNVTGVETPVLAMDHQTYFFAVDNFVDIGMNGFYRPKNIYMAGDLWAQLGSVRAATTITADTGMISATAGDVRAGVNLQATQNLIVNGGDIGLTGDLDLIQIAVDDVTINGDVTIDGALDVTADIFVAGGDMTELTYWYQDNVAISQTDAVLDMDGNASRTEVPTVRAGSVIGITVYSNEARTAGTLTVEVTIDGVGTGLTAVLDGTNPSLKVTTQAKDTDAFTAGQRIGATLTTDGTWAPVTADITVVVLIEQ